MPNKTTFRSTILVEPKEAGLKNQSNNPNAPFLFWQEGMLLTENTTELEFGVGRQPYSSITFFFASLVLIYPLYSSQSQWPEIVAFHVPSQF